MQKTALDNLLAAHSASNDARLLLPALDLCASDDDRVRVLAAAQDANAPSLSDADRARSAEAALAADEYALALRLADGVAIALASEVRARLAREDRNGALVRYRSAVPANPALE